jgi:hypothetical protein
MQRNPADTFAGSIDLLDTVSANFRWIFDVAFTVLALRLEVRDFWQGVLDILITKRADSSIKILPASGCRVPKTDSSANCGAGIRAT